MSALVNVLMLLGCAAIGTGVYLAFGLGHCLMVVGSLVLVAALGLAAAEIIDGQKPEIEA